SLLSKENPPLIGSLASSLPSQESPTSIVPLTSLFPLIEGELGESDDSPSPTSLVTIDLETLIIDIRNRYTSQEFVPKYSSLSDYTPALLRIMHTGSLEQTRWNSTIPKPPAPKSK
ncbi:hypothetical protein HAX54_007506, partial [Datura stramonium]|nr:hypothetical protein [Datura stramonium]